LYLLFLFKYNILLLKEVVK